MPEKPKEYLVGVAIFSLISLLANVCTVILDVIVYEYDALNKYSFLHFTILWLSLTAYLACSTDLISKISNLLSLVGTATVALAPFMLLYLVDIITTGVVCFGTIPSEQLDNDIASYNGNANTASTIYIDNAHVSRAPTTTALWSVCPQIALGGKGYGIAVYVFMVITFVVILVCWIGFAFYVVKLAQSITDLDTALQNKRNVIARISSLTPVKESSAALNFWSGRIADII